MFAPADLPGAGRTHKQHIAFLQLQVAPFFGNFEPLVMIVDGDRQFLFGRFLPNHVKVEKFFYFLRFGELLPNGGGYDVIRDYFVADIDAFIANVYGGSGNELFDVVLAFGAE